MLKIAICDDTREERELVETVRKSAILKPGNGRPNLKFFIPCRMSWTPAAACDLYLLDVLMPGKSGIQGAADLLKLYADPVIIFITSSLESAVDSYRVCASGFLLKPVRLGGL